MTFPLDKFSSPVNAFSNAEIDNPVVRTLIDSLATKLDEGHQRIIEQFALTHFRAESSDARRILPRILTIVDSHSHVIGSSGIVQTLKANIKNTEGAPGLLHEFEVFHIVNGSRHRTQPTLLRSEIEGQEIDVRTRFFDGLNVLFEAKLRRTRGNQCQLNRLVHAAMGIGAKLVYVSASDTVHDDGIVSLTDLENMLEHASPEYIADRFSLAHETNLSELQRDALERLPKPASKARIRTRIDSSRRARGMIKKRENRDNCAILDAQLYSLSCDDAISLWDWIGADPQHADERFEFLYEQGVAELIVEDLSREFLKKILSPEFAIAIESQEFESVK